MADEVTKETDRRLDEAAMRVDKVLSDMEDLASVGESLLAARRGLSDASKSIAGLADRAGAAIEQWKAALAAFDLLQKEAIEARESATEAAGRLRETVESSSRETSEKVAHAAALVERTQDVFEAELKRLRILLWAGCAIGAAVAVLMVIQLLVP